MLRLATSRTPKLLPSSVATNYEPKLYRLQPDRVQAELWANSQWCNFCWQSLQLWTATVVFGVLLASGRLRTAIAGTVLHSQTVPASQPTNQIQDAESDLRFSEFSPQLALKLPTFYGTRRFIAIFTRAHSKLPTP